MSEINKKLIKHAVTYGLMLAGIQILIQLLTYIFNANMFSILYSALNGLLTLVIITFLMAYASIKFRDKYLDHKISFLRCWMIGIIVGVVAMLIGSLYSYIFNNFIDPDYIVQQLERFKDMIDSNTNIPDDKKAEIIQSVTSRFKPGAMIVQGLIYMGVISILMSLLATVFVRKKEKIKEEVF